MAPVEGFWGRPTATIDWCEENYRVTYYVAEFWNTVSNVAFIIPSVVMLYVAFLENHESRYKWCHIGVFSVGFGSWCFHMTLLYSMQLLDELPMIYGSCFLLYSHVEVTSPENKKNRILQVGLFIWAVAVTVIYLSTKHVLFFQCSYALMVFLMVLSSIRILLYYKCSRLLYIVSFTTYSTGFGMWLIDQHMCDVLQYHKFSKVWYIITLCVLAAAGLCWMLDQAECGILHTVVCDVTVYRTTVTSRPHGPLSRRRTMRFNILPAFLSPLTELHAWWHILAGTGTYLSVFFSAHTRYLYLNKNPEIHFWMGFWPYLTISGQIPSKVR